MNIETLFYTQVGTIVAFVVALFVLYRVLISQKDATIQLLKEKCLFLEKKLEDANQYKPDVLAKSLSDRVKSLSEEIERLSEDKASNHDLINQREKELRKAKEEAEELSQQISHAQEMMSEYFCPNCNAPMSERVYHTEMVEHGGREIDVDHEFITYECGLSLSDGDISRSCPNT